MEDEYSPLDSLDHEDEIDLDIKAEDIEIPNGKNDVELISKMYIKRSVTIQVEGLTEGVGIREKISSE